MTDSAGLTSKSAALYINQYIELINSLGCNQRLMNDNLQSLKGKILTGLLLHAP